MYKGQCTICHAVWKGNKIMDNVQRTMYNLPCGVEGKLSGKW